LKAQAKSHASLNKDVARAKTRVKVLFRSHRFPTPEDDVYRSEQQESWIEKLPGPTRRAGEHLLHEVHALEDLKAEAQRDMLQKAKKHAIYRVLLTIPGMGPLRVAQAMPIVVDPSRFRRRQHSWAYCGLGLRMYSSSDWQQDGQRKWQRVNMEKTRGLSGRHNTTLTAIFKGVARTVVVNVSVDDPLHKHYEHLLESGTKTNLAELTIARQVAAVFLRMWKSKEVYDLAKVIPKSSASLPPRRRTGGC
jgi:hypothetical protein